MTAMAAEALGPHADLPAVQSLCQVWAADLAMMATAATQGLAPICPTLCGRGHQVAKALQHALEEHGRPNVPLHAALENIAPALHGNNTGDKLLRLAMLLDQNVACKPSAVRSASSVW